MRTPSSRRLTPEGFRAPNIPPDACVEQGERAVLFTLPGTPVLFYGEELGMGENLAAEGRQAVRTPMQWTPEKGAGFSTASPDTLPNPLVDGAFGPRKINVYEQSRDPDSLLSRMRSFIERYRGSPELAWGGYRLVETGEQAVLAHVCRAGDGTVLAVHNFADRPLTVRLEIHEAGAGEQLTDLLDEKHTALKASEDDLFRVDLPAYGYRWLRVGTPADDPERVACG
ncbi:alpha-glucosidase C-terminal domain-containing protein [Streptomyces sp. NBC_00285]|uniref:alpha-glucosidase C-terminal domain-containing protein n=1 Tax=Streptomyces sp. NBC_00285 TaxID=2975700 RepID=UPI002E2B872A|nr:alpha-glucosidase C-terminal domain-containing protein [Streptomyces sp. NBC_00285]